MSQATTIVSGAVAERHDKIGIKCARTNSEILAFIRMQVQLEQLDGF